jgi:hypothetical protein
LLDVKFKCRAVLSFGCVSKVSGTARWREPSNSILACASTGRPPPPRPKPAIPQSLEYMRQYASGMAYVDPPNQGEGKMMYRQRIYEYGALRSMDAAGSTPREMRIVMRYSTVEWDQVWINLHTTWASDNIKVMWFLVIHDLLPTNERLHRINLTETSKCKVCGEDTRLHRLIECQGGR